MNVFKQLRGDVGISQNKLAESIGISAQTYSVLESGKHSLFPLKTLAHLLGMLPPSKAEEVLHQLRKAPWPKTTRGKWRRQ